MATLGIDLGGPIAPRSKSYAGNSPETMPPIDGVFEAIPRLLARFDTIHIVSIQTEGHWERSNDWLKYWKFFERTGIPPANLHRCWGRESKRPICWRLGITHFVDDRAEILGSLHGIVARRYLFTPSEAEIGKHPVDMTGIVRVESWEEVLHLLDNG